MEEKYRVAVVEGGNAEERRYVWDGLMAYNLQHAPDDNYRPLLIMAYGPDGSRVGGLIGETFWDWLHVSILWLEEEARGQGVGSRLLAAAEAEARRRGARHAYLDTLDFQARPFYERHGYEHFATIEDMPPGHARYFMRKGL